MYDNEKENRRILTNKEIYASVKKPTITETIRLDILRLARYITYLSYPLSGQDATEASRCVRRKVRTWHLLHTQRATSVLISKQSPTCVSPCVHQIQQNRGTSWGRNRIQLATSGSAHALRTASPH